MKANTQARKEIKIAIRCTLPGPFWVDTRGFITYVPYTPWVSGSQSGMILHPFPRMVMLSAPCMATSGGRFHCHDRVGWGGRYWHLVATLNPEMLPNILQGTDRPPKQRVIGFRMWIVLRLRNSVLSLHVHVLRSGKTVLRAKGPQIEYIKSKQTDIKFTLLLMSLFLPFLQNP